MTAAVFAGVPAEVEREEDDHGGHVRAAVRTLRILRLLGESAHVDDWPLDEIATTLELPKSTTHRLLRTLKGQGFVEEGAAPASYRLGIEAAIVGSRAIQNQRPRSEVRELLGRVASEIGETVGLGVLTGRRVLVVERGVPPRPFSWNIGVGSTLPAHASAAGKILLADLAEAQVRALYPRDELLESSGPNAIRNRETLLEELARTRERGYALDLEEFEEGLRCVAVPIRAVDERVSHSLGITAPASRVTQERLAELAGFLTIVGDDAGRYLRHASVVDSL